MRVDRLIVCAVMALLAVAVFEQGSSGAEGAKPQARAAAGPASRPFVIAKETTYFTKPVRADGTIDYVVAINAELAKGVTPQNNATIPLLDAASRGKELHAAHYARVRALLGLPPLPAVDQNLPADPLAGAEPAGLENALHGPWTAEKAPDVAKWLESMEPKLKLIIEASKRDHFYLPMIREKESDYMFMVLLPHLSEFRQMCNALKARAMLELGNEDMEAFCRDAVAIVRIGRLSTHSATTIDRLVGFACEAIGLDAIKFASAGGWLSAQQVERLLAELRGLPSAPLHEVFGMAERCFFLEVLQGCAAHGALAMSQATQGMNMNFPVMDLANKDWNAAMKKANEWYDQFDAAGKLPTYAQRMKASQALDDQHAGKQQGWRAIFVPFEDRLMALLAPAMSRAYTVETRLLMDRELTEIALANSSFRSKTGEYPAQLKELAPAYFKEEPKD
ncbi:MAG TPA: hypothetical protein VH475_28730, partial [Tepidisphaeraceae bacterium]